jgi:hypothetical protein
MCFFIAANLVVEVTPLLAACEQIKVYTFDDENYRDWEPHDEGGDISLGDGFSGKAAKINRICTDDDDFTALELNLPVSVWAGQIIRMDAMVRGHDIGDKPQHYNAGYINIEAMTPHGLKNATDWGLFHGTFDWKAVSYKWQIPEDAHNIMIGIGLRGVTGIIYVDNIIIYRCTELE